MWYNARMRTYLGTWQVTQTDGFWTGQDTGSAEAVISSAVKAGICGFDTAQSYGKGRAEQVLGKILRRFPDHRFFVDTKIMPTTRNLDDVLKSSIHNLSGIDIDTLYLHWPSSNFDNAALLQGISILRDKGLCRKTGACNLPLEMLEALADAGMVPDRIQRPVSLLWTRELGETLAFCRDAGIEVAAYSPTGMGLLSGKYRTPAVLPDARAGLFCFRPECIVYFHHLLDVVGSIAQRHEVGCSAVALAWTRQTGCDIVITGARNVDQLKENLGCGVVLTHDEVEELGGAAQELETAARKVCDNIFSYRW